MTRDKARNRPEERTRVTREVGDEGGSPGDVEKETDRAPASGSEAGETWQPGGAARRDVVRDETGKGRRSP
jgi:hypothetical protein